MLVLLTLMTVAFSWFLIVIGRTMMQQQSLRDSLQRYQANPKQASWIEKYFYGWAFWGQVWIMRRLTQGSGNSFMTAWYKVVGFLFIVFAILFLAGLVCQWYIYFTY